MHESARLCVGAGVSGFSIEDYTGDPAAPLYGLNEAVERLRAARAAINASGETVLLTARSEAILRQAGGLPEALRRLAAYAEAGADVLYAPLVRTPEEVAEVVRVAGKLPVNVLAGWPGFTQRQLEDLGVKRISVGGALARAAWGGFMRAAKDIAEHGRFDTLAGPAHPQARSRGPSPIEPRTSLLVIPANAGIQSSADGFWMPAFAGMTLTA